MWGGGCRRGRTISLLISRINSALFKCIDSNKSADVRLMQSQPTGGKDIYSKDDGAVEDAEQEQQCFQSRELEPQMKDGFGGNHKVFSGTSSHRSLMNINIVSEESNTQRETPQIISHGYDTVSRSSSPVIIDLMCRPDPFACSFCVIY